MNIVNLDLKPEYRWSHIVTKYKYDIVDIIDYIHDNNYFPISLLSSILPIPIYIKRELYSISNIIDIDYSKLYKYNIFLPEIIESKSIVSKLNYGYLIHDVILQIKDKTLKEKLKRLIIKVDFIKNNKIVYSTVTFAGFVGIFCCIGFDIDNKIDFSVVVNESTIQYIKGYLITFIIRKYIDSYFNSETNKFDILNDIKHLYYNRHYTIVFTTNNNIEILEDSRVYNDGNLLYNSFKLDCKDIIKEKLTRIQPGKLIKTHIDTILDNIIYKNKSNYNTYCESMCICILIPKGKVLSIEKI